MKEGHLGIYYLDYSAVPYPKSTRKLIIGYTRDDFLERIKEANIPEDWMCWLSECNTPGYLVEGNIQQVAEWIGEHISNIYGEPWKK